MKKILLLVSSTIMLANTFFAQDAADKKFRFGLKISPTPTWLRSSELKSVESSGVKFGFGFGLQAEFRINSTASFVTGIGGDMLGGKQTYKKSQGYVLTNDDEFTDFSKTDFTNGPLALSLGSTTTKNKFYEITSRNVKASYVTIPLLLKLMTKDVSGFKYFGMFGGNLAIQTKYSVSDNVTELVYNATSLAYETSTNTKTVTDLRPSGDLIPLNVGLNIGMGAEYNLSGSTSIFFSVNYLRGFVNQYQPTSQILVDKMKETINTSSKATGSKQSAFSDAVQINVGILF